MKQAIYKILILDIDNTLNTWNPDSVIESAALEGFDAHSEYVQNIFKTYTLDLTIPAREGIKQYFPLMKLVYDRIYILTGRRVKYKDITEQWLTQHGFFVNDVFYRENDDDNYSHVTKKKLFVEWFDENITAMDYDCFDKIHIDILDDESVVLDAYMDYAEHLDTITLPEYRDTLSVYPFLVPDDIEAYINQLTFLGKFK